MDDELDELLLLAVVETGGPEDEALDALEGEAFE